MRHEEEEYLLLGCESTLRKEDGGTQNLFEGRKSERNAMRFAPTMLSGPSFVDCVDVQLTSVADPQTVISGLNTTIQGTVVAADRAAYR